MRECKRLIKEFDQGIKEEEASYDFETNKMLSEKKQSMIKELNSYVALRKKYSSSLEISELTCLMDLKLMKGLLRIMAC
ncbi:novel plant SNARE 13-like [Nymphaea colorata]|uniref:novel plant SNARE 13-like n=1 Tax=Nymphaea colorata TaxID=210225 RepID=UPI00129EB3EB|nr:novel plant SNARE 13-like [Nymphaea colorata]